MIPRPEGLYSGHVGSQHPLTPLYPKPYVVLYGRDDCGFCQALRHDLEGRRIPYLWKRIDEESVMAELTPRMREADLDVESFDLPVVDVNAELMVRPSPDAVAARYR